jgi:hypothetical protein
MPATATTEAPAPDMLATLKRLRDEIQNARPFIVLDDPNGYAAYNATALAVVEADKAIAIASAEAAPKLLKAFEAAVERMEAVAAGIPIQNRHKRVSPATHVSHMASHLAQHAKIARAAIANATGR